MTIQPDVTSMESLPSIGTFASLDHVHLRRGGSSVRCACTPEEA